VRLSSALSTNERPPLEPLVDELFALADANPSIVMGFVYGLAHAAWLEGDAEILRRVARRAEDLPRSENRFEAMWRPLLRAKLALVDGDRATGLRTLRACAEAESATPLFNILGSARALLAGVLLDAGRTAEALREIEAELAACQAQGAPGRILWEGGPAVRALRLARARGTHRELAARLLAEIGDAVEPRPASAAVGDGGESLTPRELEVLAAIAGGAPNRAIADQLVVTERTVKAHVTSILAKLGVSSRTQAIARGRELGIV